MTTPGAAAAAAAACACLTALKGWYWDIPGPIFLNYIATYNVSQDTLQVTPPPATPAFFSYFSLSAALCQLRCHFLFAVQSANCFSSGPAKLLPSGRAHKRRVQLDGVRPAAARSHDIA